MEKTLHVTQAEIQRSGGLQKFMQKFAQGTPEEWIGNKLEKLPEQSLEKMAKKTSFVRGRGRVPANRKIGHRAGEMNKLEAKYAEHLEARKQAGEIVSWRFEEITFRLAKRTGYTPDFQVIMPDGSIQYHETKGFMRDDANVKLKAVAEKFREFDWLLVQWDSKTKNWKFEEK